MLSGNHLFDLKSDVPKKINTNVMQLLHGIF